ncbi:hypothetical protein [Bacillus gaemokensis]|uniref:Uncharacterized protein n=1 Tax=Bacillus gaemokensis TaxID=574375 RepID=A0A073K693_9BACI|nr:hypothetical protein [Bacillus gaemokensis]KEK22061.1 hypothetical protein BAGA_22470 [Bacillus gaemokensis]KYG37774.1 hypothetical protein AZF08_21825 [Bacillus gaemokensis]
MERKINKMMRDLQFLMKHGQIGMDLTDFKYQELLFGALEITGKKFATEIYENTLILKLRYSKKN